ncbi:hypothetical protein LINPERHAP2_LOCUS16930 [Linum perenne]
MLSFLSWNCRGAGNKHFCPIVKHYMQTYNSKLLAILEPRISAANGKRVRDKLGFDFSIVEEAQGFTGGIWLLWKDPNLQISVINSSNQFIHVAFQSDEGASGLATFVYGSPHLHRRRELWRDLQIIAASVIAPWIVLGDFNAMIGQAEQCGVSGFNEIQAREFRECIFNCDLIDSGFTGPNYTWFRGEPERTT